MMLSRCTLSTFKTSFKFASRNIASVERASATTTMPVTYISPDVRSLHALDFEECSDKVPHKDYLVIDVRDDDFVGGNIKDCHNLPSHKFHSGVDELIKQTKDVPTVIFHCALSQQRGPKAAQIYAETRDNLQREGQDKSHQVFVLRGGFTEFQEKFKDDPLLVENYDATFWNPDASTTD
ncbi:hypothetical protein EW146_g4691 [Bondarzewia mesenterica]|uniref:Rhodanese domain-containing protein n=1 Tax=Bondarzewia mesenterica TaxID=1095465 RepID=A0A4S4LVW7_9AGAM|nr:hypothetical protein EW146_g4691 [Bondarzewia mesenterica]